MVIKRISSAFKLFLFGFYHPSFLNEQIFVTMAEFFEIAIKVATNDKPFTTHLYMWDKRIVSFWMYPGLAKNPVDRITELLHEIEGLKEALEYHNKEPKS
jgi:hypothetical protein